MIHFIIFSYNRAPQLAVLLGSIIKNVKGNYKCTIIYNTSELFFEDGYLELKRNFTSERFEFIKEKGQKLLPLRFPKTPRNIYHYIKALRKGKQSTNFKLIVENTIKNSPYNFIAFFTDDSFFYREFSIPAEILSSSGFKDLNSSFSTRLGLNTIDNKLVNLCKIDPPYYSWAYYSLSPGIQSHYNYPFSVDGNIYSKNGLLSTIKKVFYFNPNSFESYMVSYIRKNKLFEQAICNENSCLVGFEVNQVNLSANSHFNISIRDLNTWYLNKYVMKYIFDSEKVIAFRPFLKGIQLQNTETSDSIYLEIMK